MRHHEALAPEEIGRKGRIDMVTVADRESEALVVGRLRARFPDHGIVAEESAALAGPFPADVPRWYVDPLDGTTTTCAASRSSASRSRAGGARSRSSASCMRRTSRRRSPPHAAREPTSASVGSR